MGTALALLLARSTGSIRLWARDPVRARLMRETRANLLHLPGALLPENILVTSDPREACDGSDLVVVAIPTAFLRSTLLSLNVSFPPQVPALSVVKGIEQDSFARPSEIIVDTLGSRPVAVLSGPSHAEEIARGLPASVVVASDEEPLNVAIQEVLNGPTFRVYTNSDVLGVELAGAMKNILGIAAGICDGLGFGDNAKAALLTRGLVEIARFSCEMGARPSTFLGLAGVGDVITTCYSPFGRNRSVGIKIGQGATLPEALVGMTNVAEGVTTARSVHALARSRGVAMPITDEVYRILHEGKPPRAAVTDLMLRLPKVEWP
ncbi:MAG: glycerol-3-phosphate dehydrogenase [Planctomycetota bacterium]|nr:glycerol-3-phosphate dehydrogenase [Planctomycetota bacterium]